MIALEQRIEARAEPEGLSEAMRRMEKLEVDLKQARKEAKRLDAKRFSPFFYCF